MRWGALNGIERLEALACEWGRLGIGKCPLVKRQWVQWHGVGMLLGFESVGMQSPGIISYLDKVV